MNDNTGIFSGGWLWAFLIIALLFGGGLGGFGGGSNAANTERIVNSAIAEQNTANGLRDILLSSSNNNYETARLLSEQNAAMMQQNNTNLVNAIQGFNAVNSTILAQGSGIQEAIARLGFQMDSCCCAIKSQLLQDKYDRLYEQYRSVQVDASNAAQTQTLLAAMGRWVANPPAVAI